MKKLILLTLFLASCTSNSNWTVLFDGEKVNGLRGYRQTALPDSWEIVDGTLKTKPEHGVDLISEDIYKNFELELEWKVPIGGNSGIFYYATEEGDYIWQSAPEMQVLDNDLHTDGKNTLTSAGSLYAMIAPSNAVVKPVGKFNKVRIKVFVQGGSCNAGTIKLATCMIIKDEKAYKPALVKTFLRFNSWKRFIYVIN